MTASSNRAWPDQHVETEGKWRLGDAGEMDRVRTKLQELGAQWLRTERELNLIFDDPAETLRRSGRLLRIRVVNGAPEGRMTVKGPSSFDDGIKSREELEVIVDDAETARAMMERLAYEVNVEYPKLRESWRLGSLEIALDELPFGSYCEIEGPAVEIRSAARALGLTELELQSYPMLIRLYLGRD